MKVPLGQCNIPFLSESHFSINHPSIPSLEDLHFFFSQCYSLLSLGQSISYSTPSLCPNLQKLYLCQTFFFFSYCPVITSINKSDSFLSCKAVFLLLFKNCFRHCDLQYCQWQGSIYKRSTTPCIRVSSKGFEEKQPMSHFFIFQFLYTK